jgi:glycosyltransferase involved in cell wall biosynthesis
LADFSVIILSRNECRAIQRCVNSVIGYAHEVVVVDSRSDDGTQELATAAGARVIDFLWDGQYPKKKEWAVRNCNLETDWVLLLDADETMSAPLALELARIAAEDTADGVLLTLLYFWRGAPLRHGQRVTKLSFFKSSKVEFPRPRDLTAPGIREVEGHYQPIVHGRIVNAANRVLHDDPDSVSTWFDRHNRYSDWEAFVRTHPDVRAVIRRHRSRQGRALERMPLKPVAVFLFNYVARGGLLDGLRGLEYAACLAFYQFQIGVKVRELLGVPSQVAWRAE